MLPRLYLYWAAVVFCAAIALISGNASTHHLSHCFTFQAYDVETRTAVFRNSCSECRNAVIQWCDGSTRSLKVSQSTGLRVHGFRGCVAQITADYRCAEQPAHYSSRQSQKRLPQVKKDHAPLAISSNAERPPLKPSDDNRTAGQAASGQGASAAQDGPSAAANSMQALNEPAGNRLVVIPPQKDAPGAQPKIEAKTRIQMAIFPDASEHDWGTLLCSESGQSLIRETEALLSRRAVLQIMLGELWFSPDVVEKQQDWIAAEKEVQAINKELNKFQERAKAVIDGKETN